MIRVALFNRNLNDPRPSGIKTVMVEILRRLLRDPAQRFQFTFLVLDEAHAAHLATLFEPGPWRVVRRAWEVRAARLAWLTGWRNLSDVMGPHDVYWAGVPWPYGRRDRPLVVTVHDFFPLRHFGARARWRQAASALWFWLGVLGACARAAQLVAISRATAGELRERRPGGLPPVAVVPNGVDLAWWAQTPSLDEEKLRRQFHLPPVGPLYVSLGAQEEYKNHRRIVQAFAETVRPRFEQAALLLIGPPGPETPALRSVIAERGLEGRVILTGPLPRSEVHAALSHATALVFASLMEGFGIPILEAFAAGAPVITSNRMSMPEVAGSAAILVNPENGREIGEAMLALATDSARREQLIAAGRERVPAFTWDAAARQYAEIFCRLAGAPPAAPGAGAASVEA